MANHEKVQRNKREKHSLMDLKRAVINKESNGGN